MNSGSVELFPFTQRVKIWCNFRLGEKDIFVTDSKPYRTEIHQYFLFYANLTQEVWTVVAIR
jgi:hypothetical protein